MEKTVFEQMGGTYNQQGDYLIPCLALPDEQEQSLGLFGQRHLRYLKEHHKVIYYNLLTSGKLNSYLAEINEQAEKRYELITEQMKQAQGITEQLKAENIMEWTGRMNNICSCAMEIVHKEIVFA